MILITTISQMLMVEWEKAQVGSESDFCKSNDNINAISGEFLGIVCI